MIIQIDVTHHPFGKQNSGKSDHKKGIIKQNKCDTRPIRVYYYEIADTDIV